MSRPDDGSGSPPHTRVSVSGLCLRPGESTERLPELGANRLGLRLEAILSWKILRRSLDARGRRPPRFVYRLGVELSADALLPDLPGVSPWPDAAVTLSRPSTLPQARPIVVGAGPAGLFAALRLTAYGLRPLILERGAPVDKRVRDVALYWRRGALDPESNVQFGEGGAGTFSDGKLTYRGRDFRKAWVFEQLVGAGAPEEILFEARPHLGTDRVRAVLRRIRKALEQAGAEVRFHTRVEKTLLEDGRALGVETGEGTLEGFPVFLAPGHSARDLIATLVGQGVSAEPKGFAVGLRVEMLQAAVDHCQYGRWSGAPGLAPAEFAVTSHSPTDRDVYSFCMCPGGVVIPAGSEPGGLVVNGMSASGRTGRWANAALVVAVSPSDFGGDPLKGFSFQREWEGRARRLAGEQAVPAQTVEDFLAGRLSSRLPRSSCPWKPVGANLAECLPPFAAESLRGALPRLIGRFRPLEAGLLIGVETRTSSPVRLVRGETFESIGIRGLYPMGEGAGYAGGIVSAAIDGARVADAYVQTLGGGPNRLDCHRK